MRLLAATAGVDLALAVYELSLANYEQAASGFILCACVLYAVYTW